MKKATLKTKNIDRELLALWRSAWEQTDGSNPTGVAVDRELAKSGYSIADILNRIGMASVKPEAARTADENALIDFWKRTNAVSEMALVDKCATGGVQGAMFLLKTKHGYREGTDINLTSGKEQVKRVRRWGEGDEETEEQAESTDEVKAVAVGGARVQVL